jgi:cell division protein FtsA
MARARSVWQRRSERRRQRSSGSPVYFSVVEPGTTILRLLVVEVTDGQVTVWGWAERRGTGGLDLDAQWLVAACEEVRAQAEDMAQELTGQVLLPDQILAGLPGSQLRGQAWSVTQKRSRPDRPVEERELEALLERALRLAVNRLGGEEPGWLLVDAAPVSLTIDGRRVTDPVGFRGGEVGATVFAALARAEVVESWGLVARELEFSSLTLTATPLALAAGVPDLQGILVDVGGATTDLTWCRAGRPVILDSLSTGGEALTRALGLKWRLTPNRAEYLKRAYASGQLSDEANAQVRDVMSPALQAWLGETEAAMARMNREEPLPQRLYLLGGGSAVPEIADALRSLAWSQRLHFARYPQVDRLEPTDVPGVVNRTGFGRNPGDVSALALAAWAASQDRPPERPARILAELYQGELSTC